MTPSGECEVTQGRFSPPSDHPTLEPQHIVDEKVVNEHHQDFMFLDCIKFINEVGGANSAIWWLSFSRLLFLSPLCFLEELLDE